MDRSVKERLIGAAVLVLLAVWIIPWVLDGPDEPPTGEGDTEEPDLRLPVPGNDDTIVDSQRTQTIELDVTRTEKSGPIPGAAGGAADDARQSNPASANAEAVQSAPRADAAVAVAEPDSGDAPPRVLDRESERAAASVIDNETAGWWVQVGSFGDEANARRQSRRVNEYGYEPEISDYMASGRTMYRVRVGPIETRASAQAAASALSAHGFVAQLIAPD